MTPERSRHINAQAEQARREAEALGFGLIVDIYDCGGYATIRTSAVATGGKTENRHACTPGHPGHNSVPDRPQPDLPSQAVILLDLARICSRSNAEEIVAGYYLIPRHELPEVPAGAIDRNGTTVGRYYFSGPQDRDLNLLRRDLYSVAAWADYLEQHEATKAAEEQAAKAAAGHLQARRNELARQIASEAEKDPNCRVNYAGLPSTTKVAVDRIIALEDQQP